MMATDSAFSIRSKDFEPPSPMFVSQTRCQVSKTIGVRCQVSGVSKNMCQVSVFGPEGLIFALITKNWEREKRILKFH